MRELDHQVRAITSYVEGQTRGEESATHAERLISTKVMGTTHEVWDVRTDSNRYWVVTNPTNLYSQDDFQSADVALTFHVGITVRLAERSRVDIDVEHEQQVDISWRKYEQAVEAHNGADEAEGFQAVGVRCREALIALGREISSKLPTSELQPEQPKAADFKGWAGVASQQVATGRLRSYMKAVADHTWDLTVWLQHYSGATHWDAELVLDATSHTISTYGMALHRHSKGQPARCPRCDSYKVEMDSGIARHEPHVQWREAVCGACENRWNHEYIRFDEDASNWVVTELPES